MKFSDIRDRGLEFFEQSQDKARTFWMGLNQREKIILGSLAGLLSVLLVVFVFRFTLGAFLYRQAQVESAMQNAGKIQRMAYELVDQKRYLLRYERMLQTRGENFNFKQYLEQQANRYGVSLESISPSRAQTTAEQNQELFEIKLDRETSLDSALRFLESVESAIGVRIVDLKIKSFANAGLEIVATIGNAEDL